MNSSRSSLVKLSQLAGSCNSLLGNIHFTKIVSLQRQSRSQFQARVCETVHVADCWELIRRSLLLQRLRNDTTPRHDVTTRNISVSMRSDANEVSRLSNAKGMLGARLPRTYPLVNVYIANWKIHPFFMGKSTISTGPFSIAFCMFTRNHYFIAG